MKHAVFKDKNFETFVTLGGAFFSVALVLGPYWGIGWFLISRHPEVTPPSPLKMACCVCVYALGVVIMMVADAQKHFTLKYKRGLITSGMFRFVRRESRLAAAERPSRCRAPCCLRFDATPLHRSPSSIHWRSLLAPVWPCLSRASDPNYTGEIMIYGAFGAMVNHWLPWCHLLFVWTAVFSTNMAIKEHSMSRYVAWADYRRQTGALLPWPNKRATKDD